MLPYFKLVDSVPRLKPQGFLAETYVKSLQAGTIRNPTGGFLKDFIERFRQITRGT